MKKSTIAIVVSAALLGMTAAQASEFDGGWIGGKIGSNRSSATGVDTQNATAAGLEAGHNWNMGGFLLGVDGFVDSNSKATHNPGAVSYGSSAYGLDAKLGLPSGNWLPYAKLGYARTNGNGAAGAIGGSDVHLGLGVEYKFAPHWSVAGEYTTASAKSAGTKLNNNNFTLGINYYFDAPAVAPVAPVAMKAEPKAAPAPVPETWKTLLENKPVCIEGANFEFDSAKLRGGEIKKLEEVVSFAAKYKDAKLESSGHTCSIGSEEYNQKLSERRAASVRDYLTNKGVSADRISVVGYGESKPVADNKTREGREQNRRVEVCTVLKVEKKVRVTE
ncbi:MAG: OmpA family protein [Nitrosomonadales bacterium]|nr:OmpA family protein [Nitrosomonadales bacterium]